MAWEYIKLTKAKFTVWQDNAVVVFKQPHNFPNSTITVYAESIEHKHNDTHVYAVFDDTLVDDQGVGLDRPEGESYDPSIIFTTKALAEADGLYEPEDKNGTSQYSVIPTSRGFKLVLDEETTATPYSVLPVGNRFRFVLDNVNTDYYNI